MSEDKPITLYMGRSCTMWATWQEARDSWRRSRLDLLEPSPLVWWRATRVVPVSPPDDVDLQQTLREDL